MKFLALALISIFLSACQGLDINTDDSENDLNFNVSADLSNKILFSDKLLKSNVKGAFLLRIDEEGSDLEEIAFEVNDITGEILSGDHAWELIEDKLRISYPNAINCTTTKTEQLGDSFNTKVSCSGGSPDNAEVEGLLKKPISLGFSTFSNKKITLKLEDNKTEILDFDDQEDRVLSYTIDGATTERNGEYEESNYTNVIRAKFTADEKHSLFILIEGTFPDGTILELRYADEDTESKKELKTVRLFSTDSENNWTLIEEFKVKLEN